MRSLAFASLVFAAALAGACTAVDNFNDFKFVDGGGSRDLGGQLPGFGQPCTDSCAPGPVLSRPLSCFTQIGGKTVPGGICTRTCTASAGAVACSDYPDSLCVTVENTDLCLPRCDPSMGRGCRTGFGCCMGGNVVTGPGACAPTQTNLCH
jgi:hypothetical protein